MTDRPDITNVVAVWLLQTIPAIEELETAGRTDMADSLFVILQELYRLYSARLPGLEEEFNRLGELAYGNAPQLGGGRVQ